MGSWLPWVRRRRARLRAGSLTDDQAAVVERNVPAARGLSDDQRDTFEGLVLLFLHEKTFEGCGGLELTDEMELTIAGHACLLLVGLDSDVPYPGLDVIRVYPSSYVAPGTDYDGRVAVDGPSHRLGESSRRGYIVLSWDDVLQGARTLTDGQNVVLHEFAHQLDTANGVADGAPVLPERGLYGPWARILGAAFDELQQDVADHRRTVLDAYGAHSPAEFFAVATESFFEQAERLQEEHPKLYAVLKRYYGQDPANRELP